MLYSLTLLWVAWVVSLGPKDSSSVATLDASGSKIAPLHLEHGAYRPSQAVARAAYEALSKYLHALKAGELPSAISPAFIAALPTPAEPALDSTGYWRLGAWLLEARSGSLALTYRPAQPEPRFQYVVSLAPLERGTETTTVTSLSIGHIYPRR